MIQTRSTATFANREFVLCLLGSSSGSAALAGLALDARAIQLESDLPETRVGTAGVAIGLTPMAITCMNLAPNIVDGSKGLAGAAAILVQCSCLVFETRFTNFRRIFLHTRHPGLPEVAYVHHLVCRRLVRWLVSPPLPGPRARSNALCPSYLWRNTSVGVLLAVLFCKRTLPLMIGAPCFAELHVFGHPRLDRFGSPGREIVRRGRTPEIE